MKLVEKLRARSTTCFGAPRDWLLRKIDEDDHRIGATLKSRR
jgi:hypothetical protein